MDYTQFNILAKCAQGRKKAELVLKNADIVNVFSEEIVRGDIAIQDGMIVGVGNYSGDAEVDLTGKVVCPGFIDAHLHLETSFAAPADLVHAAMRCGTTTFIIDPHEAVNVAGEDGLDYMLELTGSLDAQVYVMLPSCVPATKGEENGCEFTAARMDKYKGNPRVLGLGEVMDYVAVTGADPDMVAKLALFDGYIKDGHAPDLTPHELAAYALAKIKTDHECIDYDYAMQQVRNGLVVLVREGTGMKNVDDIVAGIVANGTDTSRFAFCTDEKHINDIEAEGHIDFIVRKAIQMGVAPIKAIKMATLNAATCYHLEEVGAIAPGYWANLVVLDSLSALEINAVYCSGKLVGEKADKKQHICPEKLCNTICVPVLDAAALAVPVQGETNVIEMVEGQIVTRHLKTDVPTEGGLFVPNAVYNKVAVIERHHGTGHVGAAPVKGFNLSGGAIASSVSHDSHNIVAVGDSDEAILAAVEELKRVQGGFTIVRAGKVAETLPLPIMGIMTDADVREIRAKLESLYRIATEMGVPDELDAFMALSFIALPVIPELRITTKGLFDAVKQAFV